MSEADIMKENAVYERLYKQEPKALPWYSYGTSNDGILGGMGSMMVSSVKRNLFSWNKIDKYSSSESSRARNEQKLWTRPTI